MKSISTLNQEYITFCHNKSSFKYFPSILCPSMMFLLRPGTNMEFGVRIFVFHIRILTNIRFQCLSVEFNKFVRHTSCPILVLSNYFECFITLLLCFKLIVYPKRILKINFNSIVYRTFVDCFDVCWWSECMLEIKLLFSVPVFIFFTPTWIMSEKGLVCYNFAYIRWC